jgi:protoporphyrinogen oxidase
LTIVGGGLAGLTSAISSAERGAAVTLHEAHSTLGGRARSTPAPYIANDGTHAFYDGPPWRWLQARNLVGPTERLTAKQLASVRLRHGGRLRRVPPLGFTKMVCIGRSRRAPIDRSFRDWATTQFGDEAFAAAAGMVGPALYEADPGRLSAAFVSSGCCA